jgi:L-iditol 2-dehydrogenase
MRLGEDESSVEANFGCAAVMVGLRPGVPRTMQAAVYRAVDDVQTEEIAVPEIGAGEVLVRIDTCGICGTDLKKIHTGIARGAAGVWARDGGDDCEGRRGCRGFKVGDRVMAFHHIPCGHCFYCRKQTFAQCETYKKVGTTAGFEAAGGGFAEYIRVMDWIVGDGGYAGRADSGAGRYSV